MPTHGDHAARRWCWLRRRPGGAGCSPNTGTPCGSNRPRSRNRRPGGCRCANWCCSTRAANAPRGCARGDAGRRDAGRGHAGEPGRAGVGQAARTARKPPRCSSRLSGRAHQVYSGVCLFHAVTRRAVCFVEETQVVFRPLDAAGIEGVSAADRPAGQGRAATPRRSTANASSRTTRDHGPTSWACRWKRWPPRLPGSSASIPRPGGREGAHR